jgi:hypothetical protein
MQAMIMMKKSSRCHAIIVNPQYPTIAMTPVKYVVVALMITACGGKSAPKPITPEVAKPLAPKTLTELCAPVITDLPVAGTLPKPEEPGVAATEGDAAGDSARKVAGMKDLEALAKAKSYMELAKRGLDVPPAKRNARWEELITLGVNKQLSALDGKGDSRESYGFAEAAIDAYPMLRKSAEFLSLRSKVTVAAISGCLKQDSDGGSCLQASDVAIKSDPLDEKLILGIADAVYGATGAKYVAAKYYLALVVGHEGSAHCTSANLVSSVEAAMESPEGDPPAIAAREIAGRWCFATFESKIKTALALPEPNSYYVNNGCGVLKGKDAAK